MASLNFSMTVGTDSVSADGTYTDARATKFLEDARDYHYTDVETPLTLQEVAQRLMDDNLRGMESFARGLEERRLAAERTAATNLKGE